MIQRILTAAVLIPFVLVGTFFAPFWIFLVIIDVLLFLCIREFKQLSSNLGITVYPSSLIFGLGFPWIWFFMSQWIVVSILLFFLMTVFWFVFTTKDLKLSLAEVSGNLFVFPYLVLPFVLISECQRNAPGNSGVTATLELLLVLIIVWLSDSAAYFVGRKFGKNKITPIISPNKSLEGFIAGLILPAIATPFIGDLMDIGYSWYFFVFIGLLVASSGIIGDLFESTLKRGSGIKDTSNLIPGHGGIIDRVDSLLLAFPTYYLLVKLFT
jgi:phosphatidate cytidylyltransferase